MSIDITKQLDKSEAFNAIAWILKNKLKNENNSPIEFTDHTFLVDPYLDNTPRQAVIKCAQIGWSTLSIFRSFHLARFAGANIIHTFPSRNMSKDFVIPKVNPLMYNNPFIKKMIVTDSLNLKEIKTPMGNRFIYYRGSYEATEAISISAHILINDEYDRSNQKVLKTFRSRLDDARRERPELGWEWRFSNPSLPGYGVDELFQKSDQKIWIVTCSHCNHKQELVFPDNIDMERKIRICSKCKREIYRDDLIKGSWHPRFPGRDVSGYHVSQMFVPWISAGKIIEDSEGDPEVFHNFTLGLPYVEKDVVVTRETIIKCLAPGYNSQTSVAIGVDNGKTKNYVIGNREGIFRVGETKDWGEIEMLRNQYNATMVIDALPYPNIPTKLAEKYKGKVFIHYYDRDKKNIGITSFDDEKSTVRSDRTKIIDFVVAELNAKDITFNMTASELDEYIYHWVQLYRTIENDRNDIPTPKWNTIANRPDHYAHATIYWRLALEKTMVGGGIIDSDSPPSKDFRARRAQIVGEDQTVSALDIEGILDKYNNDDDIDWRNI